ncbi:hypothetical protein K440DRAFT_636234 [Wilcoxina mikolae CBS 423.85]|nr:hypothetical protein K440DRAFT_636234 [Wilcoxina mikolae CBS 423.85]
MDFYNQPFKDTYRLQKSPTFQIARGAGWRNGSLTTVISVSATESSLWLVAYTIILASTFAALASLVTSLVLAFAKLRGRGNRHVMLAAFFNSESQLTAACQMLEYAYLAVRHSRKDKLPKTNRDTLRFALILASIAVANLLIAQATKFVVVTQLVVRPAARVNPDILFYPNVSKISKESGNDNLFQILQPLRAAALTQAVGRAEATKDKLGHRISIVTETGLSNSRPTLKFSYNYTITGEDLGLQLANMLEYSVVGQCESKYDWVRAPNSSVDVYGVWGNFSEKNQAFTTIGLDEEARYPPWLKIIPGGVGGGDDKNGYQFTIVPFTTRRQSAFNNTRDPWYLTEANPKPQLTNDNLNTTYRVQQGRPPMFCWQNDTYSLGKQRVKDVTQLKNLTGLRLSKFLRDSVLRRELRPPPIIQIGNNLGYFSTSSSVYSAVTSTKSINATRCNTTEDLTRLVHISYVSSREIVRNTALLLSPLAAKLNLSDSNAAFDDTGKIPYENGDFVLESKDVVALSVPVLITVPCICLFLWMIVSIRIYCGMVKAKNTGALSEHNLRVIGFQATQLYRYLDEQISGVKKYSGRTGTPFIRDIEKDDPSKYEPDTTIVAKDNLPVSVAGPGVSDFKRFKLLVTSSFVIPKLVEIPSKVIAVDEEGVVDPKTPLISQKPLYEVVMTRNYNSTLKPDDSYVRMNEINDTV